MGGRSIAIVFVAGAFLGLTFSASPQTAHMIRRPWRVTWGTDIGNVGRNVRGPSQSNIDFSVGKRFSLSESKSLELHADFFNAFNHPNRITPVCVRLGR